MVNMKRRELRDLMLPTIREEEKEVARCRKLGDQNDWGEAYKLAHRQACERLEESSEEFYRLDDELEEGLQRLVNRP